MLDADDLAGLTRELAARSASLPQDYVRGKTWMRDTLLHLLPCSMADAEALLERLEARGFVSFNGDPASLKPPAGWTFDTSSR
jgi:hypothetical protein